MIDGWSFFAGLGIFLFGIFLMEESIKLLAGRKLKTLIRHFTATRLRALTTGILSTAVLQSSSAVSLMILAFAGAGLMSLGHALSVILGSMVGTTLTAWIVALFGFSIKIDALALPLVGLGGLGLVMLGKSQRGLQFSKLLLAFGFLFLGLDFMKDSFQALAGAIDPGRLPSLTPLIGIILGAVLTAVMQSSSATIAIILTTMFSGLIDFSQAAAMVIGANVGTSVTILIGSIGGTAAKKRIALSALVFKIGTALAAWLSLPLLLGLSRILFDPARSAVLGIAAFHTLFNLLAVLIFFPLIPALVGLMNKVFPERKAELSRFIHNTPAQVSQAAMSALRREILHQLGLSMEFIAGKYGLPAVSSADDALPHRDTEFDYRDLERFHAEIFLYYARIQEHALDQGEALALEPIIRASRSIMNATKNISDQFGEIEEFGREDNNFLADAGLGFKKRLSRLRAAAAELGNAPDQPENPEKLAAIFQWVENEDKQFIASCARAVSSGRIREQEVTRLLMANRFFTQSSRMLILSMQALAAGFNARQQAEFQ